MLKTLLSQVKEYKTASLLAPLFTALEVVMELFIPFITAAIIDQGIEAGDLGQVYRYGALMIVMAFLSLCFGTLAGRFSAKASAGFACNLRDALYAKVQTFSFSNIDKYSTAGLVTRMTTDVTNMQNAYQMILRIAVRAPLMLVCSMCMCFFISVQLSAVFLVALEYHAVHILLIHNHPSGDAAPSRQDIEITEHLARLCDMMQLPLLDHIIVGDGCYVSFRESGLLK